MSLGNCQERNTGIRAQDHLLVLSSIWVVCAFSISLLYNFIQRLNLFNFLLIHTASQLGRCLTPTQSNIQSPSHTSVMLLQGSIRFFSLERNAWVLVRTLNYMNFIKIVYVSCFFFKKCTMRHISTCNPIPIKII